MRNVDDISLFKRVLTQYSALRVFINRWMGSCHSRIVCAHVRYPSGCTVL